MRNTIPKSCPSCSSPLKVKTLHCQACGTTVDGLFGLPLLARLETTDQDFILAFVKSSGSLKEMSKQLNLSYPSVRNILNEIIQSINSLEHLPTENNHQR